nr:DUF2683 family protein [uncultured Mucilaginibacter sp.]
MIKKKVYAKADFDKIATETTGGVYNSDFVKKVKQSKKEVEDGKFIMLDSCKSLWENLAELSMPK